jgi:hypothetical protein
MLLGVVVWWGVGDSDEAVWSVFGGGRWVCGVWMKSVSWWGRRGYLYGGARCRKSIRPKVSKRVLARAHHNTERSIALGQSNARIRVEVTGAAFQSLLCVDSGSLPPSLLNCLPSPTCTSSTSTHTQRLISTQHRFHQASTTPPLHYSHHPSHTMARTKQTARKSSPCTSPSPITAAVAITRRRTASVRLHATDLRHCDASLIMTTPLTCLRHPLTYHHRQVHWWQGPT